MSKLQPKGHLVQAKPYCSECIKGVVFGSDDGVIINEKDVPLDIIKKYQDLLNVQDLL